MARSGTRHVAPKSQAVGRPVAGLGLVSRSWAYLGRRMELATGTNLHKLRPISISTVQGTIGRRKFVAGRSLIKPFFLLASASSPAAPLAHSPAPPASAHGSPQELPPAPGSPLPFPSSLCTHCPTIARLIYGYLLRRTVAPGGGGVVHGAARRGDFDGGVPAPELRGECLRVQHGHGLPRRPAQARKCWISVLAFQLRVNCSTHCRAGSLYLRRFGLVSVVSLTMYRGGRACFCLHFVLLASWACENCATVFCS